MVGNLSAAARRVKGEERGEKPPTGKARAGGLGDAGRGGREHGFAARGRGNVLARTARLSAGRMLRLERNTIGHLPLTDLRGKR
jgi:hypothetical protein